ncbi:sodium-dependent transporter [Salinicoccus sp. HZC-1]|uniref:sodium-dependent transporter n=1 Tax=Salinicoccus sp. HZC-1 TaxID=3385497 RepID=UPI00398B93CA
MMKEQQAQWGSRLGFILAAAGSAVGLGAVWKFPYMVAQFGGGAFLLIFLVFTLLVGLPMLMVEFTLGRLGKRPSIETFKFLGGNSAYGLIGLLGNVAAFILLSFYSVIGGWIVVYFVLAIGNILNMVDVTQPGLFEAVTSTPWMVVSGQAAFMIITAWIVTGGIEKGIERASKIMMPLLFLTFILLIARSLTLPGAMEGVEFLLMPDFSAITSEAVLFALGQSFFALSLGAMGMLTYASYVKDDVNLPHSAGYIVATTIIITICAGLAVFPAVASFGMQDEAQGPGLLFIVLPKVFAEITGGAWFYLLFILLFLFATLTSSISMIEINVSNVIKGRQEKRNKATWIFAGLIFLFGVPSTLSMSILADVEIFSRSIFDTMDMLVSNIFMPIGALLATLFLGWKVDLNKVSEVLNVKQGFIFKAWVFIIRYLLPAVIVLVFATTLI